MEISKDRWEDWQEHPVTKAVFKHVEGLRGKIVESLHETVTRKYALTLDGMIHKEIEQATLRNQIVFIKEFITLDREDVEE